MVKKTLIPNDVRDSLSILSFFGYLGIILTFAAGLTFLSDNTVGIFLIVSGFTFLFVSKAYSIKLWINDGIQQNELSRVFGIVFGIASISVGVISIFSAIPISWYGFVAVLATIPAVYIVIDYINKNTNLM